MAPKAWTAFPHPDKAYDYAGDKLAKAWKDLHAGDQEPYPDEKHVASLLKANPKLGKDAKAIAAALQGQSALRTHRRVVSVKPIDQLAELEQRSIEDLLDASVSETNAGPRMSRAGGPARRRRTA